MCDTNVNLILVSGVIRVYFVIRPTDCRECQQCSDSQTARTHESPSRRVASRRIASHRIASFGRRSRSSSRKGEEERWNEREKKRRKKKKREKRRRGKGSEKNVLARLRARASASTCAWMHAEYFLRQLTAIAERSRAWVSRSVGRLRSRGIHGARDETVVVERSAGWREDIESEKGVRLNCWGRFKRRRARRELDEAAAATGWWWGSACWCIRSLGAVRSELGGMSIAGWAWWGRELASLPQ